jgi:hypothetical protein
MNIMGCAGHHDGRHHSAHGTGGANIVVGAAVYAVHTRPTALSNPRGQHRLEDCHWPKITDIARAPWSDRA